MVTGISRFKKGKFNQAALDEVYNSGKELYVSEVTPPASGILPNSIDLAWADTYDPNLNFTTATSRSLGQYDSGTPYKPPFAIGTSSYRVPTANMWLEVELEGTDTSCSHSINQATNTRVEIAEYEGWWKGDDEIWHAMTYTHRGGSSIPTTSMATNGLRGCNQEYFADIRIGKLDMMKDEIVNPGHSNQQWSPETHIFVKPQYYYRWHGWSSSTRFATETTVNAIVWQIHMRLVVEDENLPDDRHLARFVAHLGSDRKEYDGTQLWNIEIGRFKRVTNDWQPFSLCQGVMSKEELAANPPPFLTTP